MGLEDIVQKNAEGLKQGARVIADSPGKIALGVGALACAVVYGGLKLSEHFTGVQVDPIHYKIASHMAATGTLFYYSAHVFVRESARFVLGLAPFFKAQHEHYDGKGFFGKLCSFVDDLWEYTFSDPKRNGFWAGSFGMLYFYGQCYSQMMQLPSTDFDIGAYSVLSNVALENGGFLYPLAGPVTWYGSKTGGRLKPSRLKHSVIACYYDAIGNQEKRAEHAVKALQSTRECREKYIELGECMFDLGQFERGVGYYRRSIEFLETDRQDAVPDRAFKYDFLGGASNKVSNALGNHFKQKKLRKLSGAYSKSRTIKDKRKLVGTTLGLFFQSIRKQQYDRAFDYLANMVSIDPADIETRTLVALALETSDAKPVAERARAEWAQVIELFKSQSVSMEREPDYAIYRPEERSGLLRSVLLFKESQDKASLEEECRLTQSIGNIQFVSSSPGVRYETVRVLANVQEVEDQNYLPLTHEPGRTLMQAASEERTEKYHLMTAPFLAQLHTLPTETSAEIDRDFAGPLAKRVESSNMSDDIKGRLLAYVPAITSRLARMPDNYFVFDKDAHGENFIVSEQDSIDTIVGLDFQDRGLCPAPFEMSKFLEQGEYFTSDDDGDNARARVIDQYVSSHNEFSKKGKFNRYEFAFYKLLSDPIKALSYYCFCETQKPARLDAAKAYLQNAVHSIDVLERDHSDQLGLDELMALREIREIYVSLAA